MSSAAASLVRLRRFLASWIAPHSWETRLAVLLLLAGAGWLWWMGGRFGLALEVSLWAALFALAALLARRGGFFLFGPVFIYELVRMARRRRYFWMRALYVLALLGLLGWLYLLWVMEIRRFRGPWRASEMALFASSFFYAFMAIQYAVVVLLTPIYTAGTIAEEKDRKTIEFVLATDLRDHEIVLGKWLARIGNLTLLVLAGLPVLSGLQFLGGIDPGLVLAGFAATGLTMLSLGALGMLCSVFAKKPRDAILLTFLLAVVYHVLSGASWLVFVPITGRGRDPSLADLLDFLPWYEIVSVLNAGNIGSVLGRLGRDFAQGGRIDTVLPGYLREFAYFHGLMTVVLLTWAVLRLRQLALKQAHAPAKRRGGWGWWQPRERKLPPVGAHPMLWKEVHAERGFQLHWMFRIGIALLVLVSFIPAAILIGQYFYELAYPRPISRFGWRQYYTPLYRLTEGMNIWVRLVGTGVSCLLLLAVAVRAAGSISGERDKQTFDGLITTPLDSNAILLGKWLGSILSVRWGWLWLAAIWSLGLLTGGLHPLGVPLLPVTWVIYAAMFATVGVWFSMTCSTTLRSTIWTLLTVVGISGGHWVIMGLFCYAPLELMNIRDREYEWLLFLQLGQTPPAVLAFEAVHYRDLERLARGDREETYVAVYSPLGIVSWAVAAWVLWQVASWRFREVVGLAPLAGPKSTGTPAPPRSVYVSRPDKRET